jgi:CRP/FNR family transcriptional regulator, anaerobic regulatory protein
MTNTLNHPRSGKPISYLAPGVRARENSLVADLESLRFTDRALCAGLNDNCVFCDVRIRPDGSITRACRAHAVSQYQEFSTRDRLFRQGDPGSQIFVILSGQVKLGVVNQDGREQIVGIRFPGQLLGCAGIQETRYPWTAEALSAVKTCALHQSDLGHILDRHPAVSLRIIERLHRELRQAETLICDLGLKSAPQRVASFVLSLCPPDIQAPATVPLFLSRRETAELLGLTIETVSRALSRLRDEGIVDTARSEIRVLNLTRLRDLAGESAPLPVGAVARTTRQPAQ